MAAKEEHIYNKKKRRTRRVCIAVVAAAILAAAFCLALRFNLLPRRTYTAADFGIEPLRGSMDFNENGVDDYTDILLGARRDAENHPKYDGSYYAGGYPPDDIGVCTDVVWRAFKNAGYDLRSMVDADVAARPEAYPFIETRDSNIDFRRVGTLHVFFERYAQPLTLDVDRIDQWQPGDIVIFGGNEHIGIVSDRRNAAGRCYVIHNGGQPMREEDYFKRSSPTAHYRFDASRIDPSVLVAWPDA